MGAARSLPGHRIIPYLYLAAALPTALLLCFLIPLMQSQDEGRHFLRALQIADGQFLPQIDPVTHQAGGLLPAAAADFVRERMNPEYFRAEDRLHTLGERIQALDREARQQAPLSEKQFAVFPASAIYAPALYLPQAAGIRLARLFSQKIYIWLYSARVTNAVIAVFLIFAALSLAPAYRLVLMIPAILPMSLYQISSVSSDAGIIALSILFAALCIRFMKADGAIIRGALIACLALLTAGKPVYLPFGLLLLTAYKRLGWRRAILFCSATLIVAAGLYLAWSYAVQPIIGMAGDDYPGHNPAEQVHFILNHPLGFVMVFLRTLKVDVRQKIVEVIGFFGWDELPLPAWFYKLTYLLFLAFCWLVFVNRKRLDRTGILWGSLAALSMILAIFTASFVLWAPVGSPIVPWIQGRYYIPVLATLPFFVPPLSQFGTTSRRALAALVLAFFALSIYTTVRVVTHYYYPTSSVLGGNVYSLFERSTQQSCPATARIIFARGWFSSVTEGRAHVAGSFRVLVADEKGTILGVSDPVLAGADFPYNLLPGSSRSKWFVHFWTPNRFATLHYWLVTGNHACSFGRELKLQPYYIPAA